LSRFARGDCDRLLRADQDRWSGAPFSLVGRRTVGAGLAKRRIVSVA
jgi:hypothetical protein